MEYILDSPDNQSVAGVVSALKPNHHIAGRGQVIHDLTLALVSPLGPHQHHIGHAYSPRILPTGFPRTGI